MHPLAGYRAPGGKVTLDRKVGFADRPVPIGCGQCLGCRMQRASDWATRALHEAQITRELDGRESSFLTLTYDNENLPKDYGLHVADWQAFAKRARKKWGPFRFLHCGEYGDESRRPHYHALIFGLDWSADRVEHSTNPRGEVLWLSPSLTACWGKGHTLIGNLTRESAAYVARYAIKKVNGPAAEHAYRRTSGEHEWQVKPEYITVSLKPGLGARWFEKYEGDIYPSDETIVGGKRVHTPKYYDKLLEKKSKQALESVKKARAERVRKVADQITPERLAATEEILRGKATRRKN